MSSERSNHTTRPLHHQTQRANIQQIVCERERGRGGCCIKLLFFSPQSLFVLMSLCLFDLCHLSLSFSMSLTQLGWLSIVGTVSIFLFRSLSPFPSSLSPFYFPRHLSLSIFTFSASIFVSFSSLFCTYLPLSYSHPLIAPLFLFLLSFLTFSSFLSFPSHFFLSFFPSFRW